MVSGGDAAARDGGAGGVAVMELRWCGGVAVARWSCGGAVELRWRAATPGLAAAAAGGEEDGDWGIEVPGLP